MDSKSLGRKLLLAVVSCMLLIWSLIWNLTDRKSINIDAVEFNKSETVLMHSELRPSSTESPIDRSIFEYMDSLYKNLNLPVHFFRFYRDQPWQLCFLECLSVLSVRIFLNPSVIYLHTDRPDYWPFYACGFLIHDWTIVKVSN